MKNENILRDLDGLMENTSEAIKFNKEATFEDDSTKDLYDFESDPSKSYSSEELIKACDEGYLEEILKLDKIPTEAFLYMIQRKSRDIMIYINLNKVSKLFEKLDCGRDLYIGFRRIVLVDDPEIVPEKINEEESEVVNTLNNIRVRNRRDLLHSLISPVVYYCSGTKEFDFDTFLFCMFKEDMRTHVARQQILAIKTLIDTFEDVELAKYTLNILPEYYKDILENPLKYANIDFVEYDTGESLFGMNNLLGISNISKIGISPILKKFLIVNQETYKRIFEDV